MDGNVSVSVSPVQALIALGFYVWLIIFPIILMRKIDRLEQLVEERCGCSSQGTEEGPNNEGQDNV